MTQAARDALGAALIALIGCISIPRVAPVGMLNASTLACKRESGEQNRHSHGLSSSGAHACCGVLKNVCCGVSAPRGTAVNPSPAPPPKPAIALTSWEVGGSAPPMDPVGGSAAAQLFVDCAREVAGSLAKRKP